MQSKQMNPVKGRGVTATLNQPTLLTVVMRRVSRVLAIAPQHGLKPVGLSRYWSIIDGEPTGPHWIMEFSHPGNGGLQPFDRGGGCLDLSGAREKSRTSPLLVKLLALSVKSSTVLAETPIASTRFSVCRRNLASRSATAVVVIFLFVSIPMKGRYSRHTFLLSAMLQ
jgi:hypothetical protein